MQTELSPSTSAEWATWLASEEVTLKEIYRLRPKNLISEYRREREITRGYHGREILELLQNAGDAARNAGVPGRVRIVVNPDGVVIGNTGRSFDTGGVESLQTANLSPKRQREAVVIGDKGLGFRSILNWTRSPLVSSGALGLAFTPQYAAEIVSGLEMESEELAQRIATERQIAGELIAPRLAFPQWIAEWSNHPWPDDQRLRTIAAACHKLRIEGFDTAVGMPFAGTLAHEEAIRQLDELNPEFLLLVDSISRLEIEVEGRPAKVWSCEGPNQHRTIREGEQVLSSWAVSSFEGEVPRELLDQEEASKNRFKLTIAVPNAGHESPRRLFCYFPTDVEMPLPLLAHATVELDETRKHVNDTRANRHILKCLAERIAEIAEKQVGLSGNDDWVGGRLVTPDGAWGGELERFGFTAALKDAARNKQLVPVLGGGHCTANEAKRALGDETKWWPQRLFPEISAFARKEERKLAEHLGVEPLPGDLVVRRLIESSDLTPQERAYAIAGLLQTSGEVKGDKLTPLLCDETGSSIQNDMSVMLQPTGDLPPVPKWATIRFLHPELRRHLGRLLEANDNRELQQKLRPLGVVEYSLTALIRPVSAEANRVVREDIGKESQIRSEVLEFLWRVYKGIGGATSFPSEVSLKLLSQAGTWAAPGHLYLGEGYGKDGNVTQDLYAKWAIDKLIVGSNELGIEAETAKLTNFLIWLGVARWPREEATEDVEKDFLEAVKNELRYPVEFGETKFTSPVALAGAWISNVKTVDGLKAILKHAAPEAVLAWLALDPRAAAWERPAPEHGTLNIYPAYKHNHRSYSGRLPNYTHWQISNSPWLPTIDGNKKAPRHCLFGDRQLEALFPQPEQPDASLEHRYGVSGRISDCYIRAGVMPGLGQLGHDELYRLLLEVPPLSPDGKISRALCRWFLLNDYALRGFPGEYQKRFFKDGKLWGSKSDQYGYYKVSELRHVDFDGLPPALLKNLPIVELPKRSGALKVKQVLGVTALDRAGIHQRVISRRTSPVQDDRARWFKEAKPAIKRLRHAQTKQGQALGTLERLELILCDELHIQVEHEGTNYDHVAQEGEWFIFEDHLYVRGDMDDSFDLLADAAGVAIASIFGMADGDAFSKILLCEPKKRGKLLRRMCGDDFHEEIEAAEARPRPTYSGPIDTPTDQRTEDDGRANGAADDEPGSPEEPANDDQDGADGKTPGITPIGHVQQSEKKFRNLVIRNVRRSAGRMTGRRQMVDGDKCERMAVSFEEQSNPPRFPLEVGHITGRDAPGVDLVSFDSAEKRDAFLNQQTRDWSKVTRFIEVKGRSSSTAKIELQGNELLAARKYADRYFLYRFYEDSDGQFMVSILENPMSAEEAKSQIIEFDLERAKATQRFEFIVTSAGAGETQDEAMATESVS